MVALGIRSVLSVVVVTGGIRSVLSVVVVTRGIRSVLPVVMVTRDIRSLTIPYPGRHKPTKTHGRHRRSS